MNGGGDPLDACSRGVCAALRNTIVPKVELPSELPLEKTESTTALFNVDPRPEMGDPFPGVDKIPICVTVGQIRGRFIWDLTPEEETCASSLLVVAVMPSGHPAGLYKRGKQPLQVSTVAQALANAHVVGGALHEDLIQKLRCFSF